MGLNGSIRELLYSNWSRFPDLSAEADLINTQLSLSADQAFDGTLPPVFFVGDPRNLDHYLFIGLKPGRNRDSTPGFANEIRMISGTFEEYWQSRLRYFTSPALNSRHYWPAAKLVALLEQETVGPNLGEYLSRHIVQVELMPLFAYSTGFSLNDLEWMRGNTESGRLASRILEMFLGNERLKAVVARYEMTWKAVCRLLNADVTGPGRALAEQDGRRIQVYGLLGRNVSNAQVQTLAGVATGVQSIVREPGRRSALDREGIRAPRSSAAHAGASTQDYTALADFTLRLGADVWMRPVRANGSVVFCRRRNFFTLYPLRRNGLRVDVLTPNGFRDRLWVGVDLSIDELRRAIQAAYGIAG